jgi:hypothetical protein
MRLTHSPEELEGSDPGTQERDPDEEVAPDKSHAGDAAEVEFEAQMALDATTPAHVGGVAGGFERAEERQQRDGADDVVPVVLGAALRGEEAVFAAVLADHEQPRHPHHDDEDANDVPDARKCPMHAIVRPIRAAGESQALHRGGTTHVRDAGSTFPRRDQIDSSLLLAVCVWKALIELLR